MCWKVIRSFKLDSGVIGEDVFTYNFSLDASMIENRNIPFWSLNSWSVKRVHDIEDHISFFRENIMPTSFIKLQLLELSVWSFYDLVVCTLLPFSEPCLNFWRTLALLLTLYFCSKVNVLTLRNKFLSNFKPVTFWWRFHVSQLKVRFVSQL